MINEQMEMQKEKKTHMKLVGSITMGLSLIVSGVIILFGLLFPNQVDLIFVFKLSPLFLIFLGIEILFQYFKNHGEKIQYNFFSMFMCFIIICGCFVLAVLCQAIQFYANQNLPYF